MDKLITGLKQETSLALTGNGAVGYETTGSALVDFFGNLSTFRDYNNNPIGFYEKAKAEMPLEALKLVFYLRDIREGQGERKAFRRILRHIALTDSETLNKNLHLVPEYGRWDDLWCLLDTPCEEQAIALVRRQLIEDSHEDYPSLLAKWLPTYSRYEMHVDIEKVGHKKRQRIKTARHLCSGLNMAPDKYSGILKTLRKRIDFVERKISQSRWDEIEFAKLPAKALMNYRHTFYKHCKSRYIDYLESLVKNPNQAKSDTLYPYEIMRSIYDEYDKNNLKLLEAQWKSQKDYLKDSRQDILIVGDTSGSMFSHLGVPMYTSLALCLYCAQRNKGRFHNMFMTFSESPEFVTIRHERIKDVLRYDFKYIVSNTNVKAVFDLILDVAIEEKLTQEELPSKIVLVSDMNFDEADTSSCRTKKALFKAIRKQYEEAGYQMPNMVFWNVAGTSGALPITAIDRNAILVSGHSPVLFEAVLSDNFDALKIVLDIVNKDRYSQITL